MRKSKTIEKDIDKLAKKIGCERSYEIFTKSRNGELTQKQQSQWDTLRNELRESSNLEGYRKRIKKGHEWNETDSWISSCQSSYDFDFGGMIDLQEKEEGVKQEDIDEWRVELLNKFDHYMECLELLYGKHHFNPQRVWGFINQQDMKLDDNLLLNNDEEVFTNIADCKFSSPVYKLKK